MKPERPAKSMPGAERLTRAYALLLGTFLGLAIIKFGNPVILDQKIKSPTSLAELWDNPWPSQWGMWLLALLVLGGAWLALRTKPRWPAKSLFWLMPVVWFGWQFVSATQTVDYTLTQTTLFHFAGCVACYFLGATILGNERALRWLLAGLLVAFAFCLVRATNQRLFEFPQTRQFLVEGERTGWTNCSPELLSQLKQDSFVISTNGIEVANPALVAKLAKGRVHGTLVYPNALAGLILLLGPVAIVLALNNTRRFRTITRVSVIALTLLMNGLGMVWTGSKSGWLLALVVGGVFLFRSNRRARWKWTASLTVATIGLIVFAIRFQGYFAAGATSVGARFDYWRAALRITVENPWLGSGPGTFQRPYARLKSPEAEMARLAHNDYLEQFCDSGIPGGISYVLWVGLSLVSLGRRVWRCGDVLPFAIFAGLLGWFLQCFGEFGLYIPALAWCGFALMGWLLATSGKPFDKAATSA